MSARHAPVWYRTKPSADKLGNAPHVHGRLVPLDPPRRSIWWIIGGRK